VNLEPGRGHAQPVRTRCTRPPSTRSSAWCGSLAAGWVIGGSTVTLNAVLPPASSATPLLPEAGRRNRSPRWATPLADPGRNRRRRRVHRPRRTKPAGAWLAQGRPGTTTRRVLARRYLPRILKPGRGARHRTSDRHRRMWSLWSIGEPCQRRRWAVGFSVRSSPTTARFAFHADWEARVYALKCRVCCDAGSTTWDQFS